MNEVFSAFQYGFMQRAVLAGGFVALACACLGVFLVLRRLSLIGDGLAHVGFATVALALLLNAQPLVISLPLVALASVVIVSLSERAGIYGDAAIGLVSSFSIALGVLIASLAGGFNVDLFSFLFGSILAVGKSEVAIAVGISAAVVVVVIVFYHDLVSITFDEEYARVSGIKTKRINRLLVLLTAVTVTLGIKVVGTMLVSSLIVLPAVTALQMATRFHRVVMISAFCALFSVFTGIAVSYVADLPSGATIVLTNFVLFIVAFLWRMIRRG